MRGSFTTAEYRDAVLQHRLLVGSRVLLAAVSAPLAVGFAAALVMAAI